MIERLRAWRGGRIFGPWFRFIIVASLIWMPVQTLREVERHLADSDQVSEALLASCLELSDGAPSNRADCYRRHEDRARRVGISDYLPISAADTATWMIVGWIVALIGYWSFRWIMAGRRPCAGRGDVAG